VNHPIRLAALFITSFLVTGALLSLAPGPLAQARRALAPSLAPSLAPNLAPVAQGAGRPAPDWLPPAWIPGTDALAISALAQHGPARGPRVRSRAAIVYDPDRQQVLFEKRADNRQPVASLTKTVAALAYASLNPDLNRRACIDAEQRPTRSGAISRLSTGDCGTGWDFLGAALVASDNRAAYALAAAAGVGVDDLVGRMNSVSAQLDMNDSTWTDPSGLEDDNLSTARDIARATMALSAVPALALAASSPWWDLHRDPHPVRRLGSTNKLLYGNRVDVQVGKTGYTDTARYCLTTLVRTRTGQRLLITLLGARSDATRWADARRIIQWAEDTDSNPTG